MKALKKIFWGVFCLCGSSVAVNIPPIDMVFVEGGTFMMGCDSTMLKFDCSDATTHRVTLSGFYIGKYEVTQELWMAVIGNNPSEFKRDSSTAVKMFGNVSAKFIKEANKEVNNLPVENVSWNDVQEFLEKLNELAGKKYRLPTEAEWEYAARGGNWSKGFIYAGSNIHDDVVASNITYEGTSPVGTKQPNELGIYDMSGNVWEWVYDWYAHYTSNDKTNPTGPLSQPSIPARVIRGGSWSTVHSRGEPYSVIWRDANGPDVRTNDVGFRLAHPYPYPNSDSDSNAHFATNQISDSGNIAISDSSENSVLDSGDIATDMVSQDSTGRPLPSWALIAIAAGAVVLLIVIVTVKRSRRNR